MSWNNTITRGYFTQFLKCKQFVVGNPDDMFHLFCQKKRSFHVFKTTCILNIAHRTVIVRVDADPGI